ncbi:DedA family protein [Ningiella sp. W23]|uniref:DedA family protein n=1 Tax=Ningiella sp. W23 TaxID=3023715 RepID=UPI003757EA89
MKYASFLPLSALVALSLIQFLVGQGFIPPGLQILESLETALDQGIYVVIFLIILLESIIYVGFYFPGQFFAVILVVGAKPSVMDVVYLTLAMVFAATLGSIINYFLGKTTKDKQDKESDTKLRHLLLAMIHINSLAFFMFSQGAYNKSFKVVWLAGLLNLPYYLLLIAGTAVLSEQVMSMAENTVLLFSLIGIWLTISIIYDVRKHRMTQAKAS